MFAACRDAQQHSDWLCLITVTKAPYPAKAALKPPLDKGPGVQQQCCGADGSPPKTPGFCCAVFTRQAGFMLLLAQWDPASITKPPLFYLGGGKTLKWKD